MNKPDAADFMTFVMRRLGAANPSELSRILGGKWTERDPSRKLYKWANGESAPNFESTFELLRRTGMLKEDEAGAQTSILAPAPGPLEGLAAAVAELVRGQAAIAAELGIQLGKDAPAEAPVKPRQARPRRKRANR